MDKRSNSTTTVIAMFLISFFVIFLAVKQFFALRNSVYIEAYYGLDESK